MDSETSLYIIDKTEVLASLLNADHIWFKEKKKWVLDSKINRLEFNTFWCRKLVDYSLTPSVYDLFQSTNLMLTPNQSNIL